MLKAKVYVVYDEDGCNVEYIGCDKSKAIETAIAMGHVESFPNWLEGYVADEGGEVLLEFLDEPNPKEILFKTYMTDLDEATDEGMIDGLEYYDIDIPLDSLDIATKMFLQKYLQ